MRTLYFAETFWPSIGGVEAVSASLVSELAERGHDVLVVTNQVAPEISPAEQFGKVPVRRLPFIRAIHDRDLKQLAEARAAVSSIIRQHQPALIHAVFSGPGVWLLPANAAAPLIVSFHGSWPTLDFGAPEGLGAQTLRRAAWVTACSENALANLLATAPYLRDRSSVILNGLDPAFDGEPPPPPDGLPILLCSGRVVHEKGMDVAIDAFARVLQRTPELRLLIAGDGAELGALDQRAAALGLREHVEFLGWVAPGRMQDLVSRCSVVLVPSRLEGFGLAALEAAFMARPVVASKIGGLPEVVEDGVTGILVPADDVEGTAAAIQRLLAAPGRAREMGLAARARALERFNARRHADEWDALYRRIGGTSMGAGTAGAAAASSDY